MSREDAETESECVLDDISENSSAKGKESGKAPVAQNGLGGEGEKVAALKAKSAVLEQLLSGIGQAEEKHQSSASS